MITKATEKHINLIEKRVKEFQKVSPEYIGKLLNNPNEVIWVDEEKELVCRVRINHKKKENHVGWLIPANYNIMGLFMLLYSTFIDIYDNIPLARNYNTLGRFADNRGCSGIFKRNAAYELCYAWKELAPNALKVKWHWWDNSWVVYGKLSEIIPDMASKLKNREGYESPYSYA